MAGAMMKFEGGYLGFERCEDGKGAQYLRAVIFMNSQGRQASAPVDADKAIQFALDVIEQAALAKGLDKDKLIEMGLMQLAEEISAEQAQA